MAQDQKLISSLGVFKLLIPLYLGVVLSPLNITGTINMIPTLSEDFGVSLSLVGLAITVYAIPLVVGQVGSGALTEVLGPSRTLIAGLLVFSIACLVAAAFVNYPVFMVARAAQGLGGGLAMPVSMAMAARTVPVQRTSTAIGGIQAAFTIGVALGPAAGGLFVENLNWQWFYTFLAAAGAIAAAGVAIAYTDPPRLVTGRSPLLPLKQALAIPAVRFISAAGFLGLLALMGVLIFVAVWLQRSGLAGPAMSGLLVSIPGLVGIAASPIAGLLGDRLGNRRIVMIGIALFVIGCLGIIGASTTMAAYPPLLFLIGIGLACMLTNVGAMALSLRPDLRQAISGIFNGSRFFGAVVAPVALTPVYEAFSIEGVFVVIVVTSIILAFLLRPAESAANIGEPDTP